MIIRLEAAKESWKDSKTRGNSKLEGEHNAGKSGARTSHGWMNTNRKGRLTSSARDDIKNSANRPKTPWRRDLDRKLPRFADALRAQEYHASLDGIFREQAGGTSSCLCLRESQNVLQAWRVSFLCSQDGVTNSEEYHQESRLLICTSDTLNDEMPVNM
jgi:hypothetical protein